MAGQVAKDQTLSRKRYGPFRSVINQGARSQLCSPQNDFVSLPVYSRKHWGEFTNLKIRNLDFNLINIRHLLRRSNCSNWPSVDPLWLKTSNETDINQAVFTSGID